MKIAEMQAGIAAAKRDLADASDIYRRNPSDQALVDVLLSLCEVVQGLVDRQLTTEEDRT